MWDGSRETSMVRLMVVFCIGHRWLVLMQKAVREIVRARRNACLMWISTIEPARECDNAMKR